MNRLDDVNVYEFNHNGDGNPIPDGDVPPDNPFKVKLGVELELEDVEGFEAAPAGWALHIDDSLRNGMEFVFRGGKSGVSFTRAIDSFYAQGLRFTKGPRTSTHIHINVSDTTLGVVRSMYVISYAFENALFRVLEAKRKYCGYCMPLTEQQPKKIVDFLSGEDRYQIENSMQGPNAEKYYGFNIHSMRKHGTVELRYFPGGPTKDELLEWCTYANNLKLVAKETTVADLTLINTPHDMEVWVKSKFGEFGEKMLGIVGPEFLLEHLQEVLALLPDEDNVARQDQLVFITKPLTAAMARVYSLTSEQLDYLDKRMTKLGVVGLDEWYHQVMVARQHRPATPKGADVDVIWDELITPTPPASSPRTPRPAIRVGNYNLNAVVSRFAEATPDIQAELAELRRQAERQRHNIVLARAARAQLAETPDLPF